MSKRLTNEEFIEKARKKHGDKYDYSLVEYENAKTKIEIICEKHGSFYQTPTNHVRGRGCPLCSYEEKIIDQNKIINRFNKKHGIKYDYSLVVYTGTDNKVEIICSKHGIFEQTPHAHLKGQGCPLCCNNFKHTKDSFITKSNEEHNCMYDYSLVNYKNNKTQIKIICPIHGEFLQRPDAHLRGQGCPTCANINRTHTIEFVIEKFKNVHKSKYDYSLVKYVNFYTKVKIICSKHGIFEQTPHAHLKGQGCPICMESKGENKISKILDEKNVKFIREKRFKDCRDKLPLPFDFYLPEYNTCIEYDGTQHYYEIKHWNDLNYVKKHDKMKNDYCEEQEINLLRIKYNNNKIEKTILDFITLID
jgi:hypothetical protein